MSFNADILSLTLLSIIILVITARQLLKINHFSMQTSLVVVQLVAINLFAVAQWFFILDQISLDLYELLLGSSLSSFAAIVLTMISCLAIDELTKKKKKTLLRIPMIGLLVGMYFEFSYIVLILWGYFAISVIILAKHKNTLHYLSSKMLWALPFVLGLFYCRINALYTINIVSMGLFLVSYPLMNMTNINSMFLRREQSV